MAKLRLFASVTAPLMVLIALTSCQTVLAPGQMQKDVYDIKLAVSKLQVLQSDAQKVLSTDLNKLAQKSDSHFEIVNSNITDLYQRIATLQDEVRTLRGRIDELKYQLAQMQGQLPAGLPETIEAKRPRAPAETSPTLALDERGLLRSAQQDFNNGAYDLAIKTLTMLLERYPVSPTLPDALLMLGDCYYYKGDYREAISRYRRVVEQFPAQEEKAGDALLRTANCYVKSGDTETAKQFLQRILNQYPSYHDIERVKYTLDEIGTKAKSE
jgi:tol-pal system protein YbgF